MRISHSITVSLFGLITHLHLHVLVRWSFPLITGPVWSTDPFLAVVTVSDPGYVQQVDFFFLLSLAHSLAMIRSSFSAIVIGSFPDYCHWLIEFFPESGQLFDHQLFFFLWSWLIPLLRSPYHSLGMFIRLLLD